MRFRSLARLTATAVMIAWINPATAQDTLLKAVADGCAKELSTYCKDVSPGYGRGAACLYAHEDKISVKCAVAVYDGMIALQSSLARLDFYARHCRSDLLQYCSGVPAGEGRLFQCLTKNKATLTNDCRQAVEKSKADLQKLGIIK